MKLEILKIGNSAVSFYQEDIENYQEEIKKIESEKMKTTKFLRVN